MENNAIAYNKTTQHYKGVPVTLIVYTEKHFAKLRAKRYMLGDPKYNQNIWIPNSCLLPDGTIRPDANLDWIFLRAHRERKFMYARIDIDPRTW